MTRRRFSLLLLGLVGLTILFLARPAARWFLLERTFVRETFEPAPALGFPEALEVMGYREEWTWGEPRPRGLTWYVATGFRHEESFGLDARSTVWRPNGTVHSQWEPVGGTQNWRTAAPWLWGVTDRGSPDAPWIEAGLSSEDWWAAVTGE